MQTGCVAITLSRLRRPSLPILSLKWKQEPNTAHRLSRIGERVRPWHGSSTSVAAVGFTPAMNRRIMPRQTWTSTDAWALASAGRHAAAQVVDGHEHHGDICAVADAPAKSGDRKSVV